MLHPSTKKLIDRLAEMTRKQKVKWTQGEDGQLFHDTEGYRVIITPEPHEVQVTDALGRSIETASAEDFQNEVDAGGRPYTSFVSELYREADRYARGAEKAIDALLRGLDLDGDGVPDHLQDGPGQPMRPDLAAGAAGTVAAMTTAPDEDLAEDVTDDTESFDDIVGGSAPTTPSYSSDNEREMSEAVASMADEVNGATGQNAATEVVASGDDVMGEDIADFEHATPTDADIHPPHPVGTPIPLDETEDEPAAPVLVNPAAETPSPTAASAPATAAPAAMSGGFFGRSMGNLDRYKTQTAPASPSESTPPSNPYESGPDEARDAPETEAFEAPDTEGAPEAPRPADPPPSQRPFSLSGLSAGYGLGAAATPPAEAQASPEQAEDTSSAPRKVIDGTADLPDMDLPMELEEENFDFSAPAPEPQAETTAQPDVEAEEETEEPTSPPKAASRFNPWN